MGAPDRRCAWCEGPIRPDARADSIVCSTRCRQARHRFRTGIGTPPPARGGRPLIRRLSTYDGWALSTSSRALRDVLPLCPPGTRVAAWHRGERPTRSGGPLTAWEPVLYAGGRSYVAPDVVTRPPGGRDESEISTRRVDSLVYRPGHRLTDPGRVVGTKPAPFIRWVFDLLGALPGDELTDLFPGSGGVARAWEMWSAS